MVDTTDLKFVLLEVPVRVRQQVVLRFSKHTFIALGFTTGSTKRLTRRQMAFYSLGFRKNQYIFDTHKFLVNLIRFIVILKRLLRLGCNIAGAGFNYNLDQLEYFQRLFFALNYNWSFGYIDRSGLTNRAVSQWQNLPYNIARTNYYYATAATPDAYVLVNSHQAINLNNILHNHYTILMGINDSSSRVDGLTFIIGLNTRSFQVLYFLFALLKNIIRRESHISNTMLTNYSTQFYGLYCKRANILRTRLYFNQRFIDTPLVKQTQNIGVSRRWLTRHTYSRHQVFNLRQRHSLTYMNQKSYFRNHVGSLQKNYRYKTWNLWTLKRLNTYKSANLSLLTSGGRFLAKKFSSLLGARNPYFDFNKRVYRKIADTMYYALRYKVHLAGQSIVASPHSVIQTRHQRYFFYPTNLAVARRIFLYHGLRRAKSLRTRTLKQHLRRHHLLRISKPLDRRRRSHQPTSKLDMLIQQSYSYHRYAPVVFWTMPTVRVLASLMLRRLKLERAFKFLPHRSQLIMNRRRVKIRRYRKLVLPFLAKHMIRFNPYASYLNLKLRSTTKCMRRANKRLVQHRQQLQYSAFCKHLRSIYSINHNWLQSLNLGRYTYLNNLYYGVAIGQSHPIIKQQRNHRVSFGEHMALRHYNLITYFQTRGIVFPKLNPIIKTRGWSLLPTQRQRLLPPSYISKSGVVRNPFVVDFLKRGARNPKLFNLSNRKRFPQKDRFTDTPRMRAAPWSPPISRAERWSTIIASIRTS